MYLFLCWSSYYLSAENAKKTILYLWSCCKWTTDMYFTNLKQHMWAPCGYMFWESKYMHSSHTNNSVVEDKSSLLIWSTRMEAYGVGSTQQRLRVEAIAISNLGQVQCILLNLLCFNMVKLHSSPPASLHKFLDQVQSSERWPGNWIL